MKDHSEEQIFAWSVRYFDGELEGEELEQLNEALETSADARAVFDEVSQQAFALAEPEEVSLSKPVEFPPTTRRQPRIRVAAMAAALIALLAVVFRPSHEAAEMARLVTNDSALQLLNEAGDVVRQLESGAEVSLVEGEGVRLEAPTATAGIVFDDSTRVLISGPAEVRLVRSESGGKKVVVGSGQIEADVAKQPAGQPMVIETPTSSIEVLGTSLEVNASAQETLLAVTSGKVAMTRDSDGARVEVVAGNRARSTLEGSGPLTAEVTPGAPVSWSVDFENGLTEGWRCGKWISEESSVLAHPNLKNGFNFHSIMSSNAWEQGHHSHFRYAQDSVLYLTFRMEKPESFYLMITLRATEHSSRKLGGNAFYRDSAWHRDLQPGEWRTVRIPLSNFDEFRKGDFRSEDVDLNGMAAYSFYATTEDRDLGLEIQSIRVVREP